MKEVVPMLKITPTYISKYYDVYNKRKPDPTLFAHEYDREVHHAETLSKHSIMKIKKALDWILYLSKKKKFIDDKGRKIEFKLNFITLTLPSKQNHDDRVIVNTCLNNFLNILRNKYDVTNYMWRAEKQGNGNLHFHLITDKFIHWKNIRDHWNSSIEQLYYVSGYANTMKKYHAKGFYYRPDLELKGWTYKKQFESYKKGVSENWQNPNSTDVHSIKSVGNLKIYLLKYFTKQYQNENITCSLWRCSRSLSNLDGYKVEMDNRLVDLWYNAIDKLRPKFVTLQYVSIALIRVRDLLKIKFFDLYREFNNYVNEILCKVLELSPG